MYKDLIWVTRKHGDIWTVFGVFGVKQYYYLPREDRSSVKKQHVQEQYLRDFGVLK